MLQSLLGHNSGREFLQLTSGGHGLNVGRYYLKEMISAKIWILLKPDDGAFDCNDLLAHTNTDDWE